MGTVVVAIKRMCKTLGLLFFGGGGLIRIGIIWDYIEVGERTVQATGGSKVIGV